MDAIGDTVDTNDTVDTRNTLTDTNDTKRYIGDTETIQPIREALEAETNGNDLESICYHIFGRCFQLKVVSAVTIHSI